MTGVENPALNAFVALIGEELVCAQVLIGRLEGGYELRHVADRAVPADTLRRLELADLRALAQFNAAGAFRPLKASPDLRGGWRAVAADPEELDTALRHLYPGAVADWHAAQAPAPPVTHFREFLQRQTGMYRIAAGLQPAAAAPIVRAACAASRCLKRRLWTVEGLAPDAGAEKSLIPCLEPCAVFLEFLRATVRAEASLPPDGHPAREALAEVPIQTAGAAASGPRRTPEK